MDPYRRILVAVDFSSLSRSAIGRADKESGLHGARLTLLNVVEHYPPEVPDYLVGPENVDPSAWYREQAAKRLAALAEELGCEAAAQEVIVTESSAGQAISEYAKREHVDLIVAGIHGHWAIGLLGSTAVAIMRQAACDVLLVSSAR